MSEEGKPLVTPGTESRKVSEGSAGTKKKRRAPGSRSSTGSKSRRGGSKRRGSSRSRRGSSRSKRGKKKRGLKGLFDPSVKPEAVTEPVRMLPPRNSLWTARQVVMNSLITALATSTGPVALTGAPGMGKTALAVEYAWQAAQDNSYDGGVIWVPGDSEAVRDAAFISVARQLGLPIARGTAVDDMDALRAAVVKALESTEGWLLIFDDAMTPGEIAPYIPSALKPDALQHVLVTSSNPTGWKDHLQVGKMTNGEAARLLWKITKHTETPDTYTSPPRDTSAFRSKATLPGLVSVSASLKHKEVSSSQKSNASNSAGVPAPALPSTPSSDEPRPGFKRTAEEAAEMVRWNPLALTMVGMYARRQKYTLRGWLGIYEKQGLDKTPSSDKQAVKTIWKFVRQRLMYEGPEALAMLYKIAYLASNPIPWTLLGTSDADNDALATLLSFGLLTVQGEAGTAQLHEFLALILREEMNGGKPIVMKAAPAPAPPPLPPIAADGSPAAAAPPPPPLPPPEKKEEEPKKEEPKAGGVEFEDPVEIPGEVETATAALKMLAAAWPSSIATTPESWAEALALVPHVITVLEHAGRLELEEAAIMGQLYGSSGVGGLLAQNSGDVDAAMELVEGAVELLETAHGEKSSILLAEKLYLAALVRRKGDLDEAASQLQAIVDAGAEGVQKADALTELGAVWLSKKDPEKALPLLKDAVEVRRAGGGKGSSGRGMADTLCALGNAYRAKGADSMAIKVLREAADVAKAGDGVGSVPYAQVVWALSEVLGQDRATRMEAVNFAEVATKIFLQAFGETAPTTQAAQATVAALKSGGSSQNTARPRGSIGGRKF